MSKTFTFTINGDSQSIISNARQIASEKGISMQGDHLQGHLSGQGIHADYTVENSRLTLNVSSKPLIVPWSMVESMIAQFIDNQDVSGSA
ncbi:MAG: hypothetical protein K0U68_12100 [Gammaproteobacteria bacterium]|nr:hypothetical protein [Gammaproteobacteria bacterium]